VKSALKVGFRWEGEKFQKKEPELKNFQEEKEEKGFSRFRKGKKKDKVWDIPVVSCRKRAKKRGLGDDSVGPDV